MYLVLGRDLEAAFAVKHAKQMDPRLEGDAGAGELAKEFGGRGRAGEGGEGGEGRGRGLGGVDLLSEESLSD